MNKKSPKERAISAIKNMYSLSELLFTEINSNKTLSPDDAGVYISNLEFYIKDIAAYYHYDSVLARQVTERYVELRKSNDKICQLEQTIRNFEINSHTVSAKLSFYENIARAFYEAAGFHYGSISFKERFLTIDISSEYEDDCEPHLTSLKDLMYNLRQHIKTKNLFRLKVFPETSYRNHVKDTPENKQAIISSYKELLPDAYITEFTQRQCDKSDNWALRYSVNVPYDNLEQLPKLLSERGEPRHD